MPPRLSGWALACWLEEPHAPPLRHELQSTTTLWATCGGASGGFTGNPVPITSGDKACPNTPVTTIFPYQQGALRQGPVKQPRETQGNDTSSPPSTHNSLNQFTIDLTNDWSILGQLSAWNTDTQPGHIHAGNQPSNEFPPVPISICVSRQKLAAPGWWQTFRRGTQTSTGSTTEVKPTHQSRRAQINGKHPLAKYNTAGWFVMLFPSCRPGVYPPHMYFVQCSFINFLALRWHSYHAPESVRHRPGLIPGASRVDCTNNIIDCLIRTGLA